jgi:hypothetical protein
MNDDIPKLERLAYQMGHNAGVAHHKLVTQGIREDLSKALAVNKAFKDEHALLTIVEAQLADEKLHVKQLERGLDKALAVNKVLVGALKLISETEQSKFAQAYCANMAATALKLAGGIK